MSNFPTTIPAISNPTGTDNLSSPAHATIHGQENDEITAIATKVGVDGSAVTTTHDYKLSGVTGTDKAVSKTGSETLTNKTFTKPVVNGSTPGVSAYSPAGGGTATLDLSNSNVHVITMPAGNITIALSNESVGQFFEVEVIQDSSGSRTVTWFTTIKWANGGTAPVLTTTASKKDTFVFRVTSSSNYDGYIAGQNV